MIGMMNNNTGTDGPLEFYAGRRDLLAMPSDDGQQAHPFVFESQTPKKFSYTEFGRRLVDGKPEVSESPEEMWRKAMLRATCTRAVKEMLGEKRRKSSKLRQLIANQSGSIRHFFGTAKNNNNIRQRANQQNQQVETNVGIGKMVSRKDGPGKPDRAPV